MVALNGFNAGQVAPSVGFEPWPAGWYPVVIKASAEKPTSNKAGFFLEFQIEAIDGPLRGRTNFIRHNWKNPSADAVRIAGEQMSAMLHVIGNLAPQDTQQLHGIPFMISYKLDPAGNNGAGSNEPNGYKDIAGNAPTPGQPSTAAQNAGQQQQPQTNYGQQQGNPNGQPGGQGGAWGGQNNGQTQGQPSAGFQQNNGQPQGGQQGQPDAAGWGTPPAGQPQQGTQQGGGWNQGGQQTQPAAQGQPPAGWGGPGGAPQGGNPQWGGPQGGQQ